jgi:hypothetical protein
MSARPLSAIVLDGYSGDVQVFPDAHCRHLVQVNRHELARIHTGPASHRDAGRRGVVCQSWLTLPNIEQRHYLCHHRDIEL